MGSFHSIGLNAVLISTFVASSVEMVEMVIIVVGVGAARGWRSTLVGAGSGLTILVGIVVGLGQALQLIPIDVVRIIIGGLLLTFGLQWYRQGVIGVAAQGFAGGGGEEVDASGGSTGGALDWTAFVLSFKGVLLEGLEIAFIVVAFGAGGSGTSGSSSYASAYVGAFAAFVLIGALGLLAKSRLEQLPGRTLKFGVGGLLSTFGTFWTLEGLGVHWPGGDLSLAWLYVVNVTSAYVLMRAARAGTLGPSPGSDRPGPGAVDGSGLAPASAMSVREFQSRYGLEADGVVGPRTQAAIRTVRSERGVTDVDRVALGVDPADPDAVRALQRRLDLPVTGMVDAPTRGALRLLQHPGLVDPLDTDAVRRFQQDHDLDPTGDVDELTRVALRAVRNDPLPDDGSSPAAAVDPVTRYRRLDPVERARVREFQRGLDLVADGAIGPETRGAMRALRAVLVVPADDAQAIRDVQVRHGLPPTGTVDAQTRRVIEAERRIAADARTPDPTSEPDPHDEPAVTRFQRRCGLVADGVIGAATRQALRREREQQLSVDAAYPESVRRFQRDHDLQPDGVVGARTYATLRAARRERQGEDGRQDVERQREDVDQAGRLVDPTDPDAIRSFQRRHGLVDDGEIGPRTQTAMRALRAQRETGLAGDSTENGRTDALTNRAWRLVKGFGRFWYGFIIGDDWTVAGAVGVLIGGTYGIERLGVIAWWYGPAVILVTAAFTIRRGLRRRAADEAA